MHHRAIGNVVVLTALVVFAWMTAPVRIVSAQQAPATSSTFVIAVADASAAPSIAYSRTSQGSLTAFVDGERCTSVDVSGAATTIVIGSADQPAACGRAGATVTLYNAAGLQLFVAFTVHPGETATLTNYAPVPAQTGPSPAAAGSAGLGATGRGGRAAAVLALLAVALVAGGRSIPSRRRS